MIQKISTLVILSIFTLTSPALPQEEGKDIVAMQKKEAEANWKMLEVGPFAHVETKHLLIYAPKETERRIKQVAPLLEKHFAMAAKVLWTEKDDKWKQKLPVYLFNEPVDFGSFVRRVEKRRLEGREGGTHSVEDEKLHVAACPPRLDTDPSVYIQATHQIGMALIQRKAGYRTILPGWLKRGFGRATYYRVMSSRSTAIRNERQSAAVMVVKEKRTFEDAWNSSLKKEQAQVLEASAADFLAYGPGKKKFAALIKGFRPGENQREKTIAQALEAASLSLDIVKQTWKKWVLAPR